MVDDNEVPTISDGDMAKLANIVADRLTEIQDSAKADADTAAAVAASEQAAKDAANKSSDKGTPVTMEGILGGLKDFMKEQKMSDANEVYTTLFGEKLSAVTNSVPGFKDFLEGEDDYGNVRKDALLKIDSYDDRVKTLDRWSVNYRNASTTSGDGKVTSPVVRKQAADNQKGYDEVSDKWLKGDYNNVNDMTTDFFENLSKEIDSIR